MKTVILALFVLLAVSQGEALKCYCGGTKYCSSHVETCYGSNNVCASVIIHAGPSISSFQGCMQANECMILNHPGLASATCCGTNLCNS